jgi:hypothetical protein
MGSTLRRRNIQRRVTWSSIAIFLSQHSKVHFFDVHSVLSSCTTIFQHNWICKWLLLILCRLHVGWHELSCNFILLYCILHWQLPDCSSSLWALIINIYWCLPHNLSTVFLNATNRVEFFPPFSFLNWNQLEAFLWLMFKALGITKTKKNCSTWSFSVINV